MSSYKEVVRYLRYLVCGVIVSLAAQAVSAYPILFYSDLDSGPVGAYVTVWGKGFGTLAAVKLGGTPVTDIRSWSDTKVEFRVPANSGNGITLANTVGQVSNPLSFTTRAGRVFYVAQATGSNTNNGLADSPQGSGVGPWKDLSMILRAVKPGDIVYVRSGAYTAILNSTYSSTFLISPSDSGTAGFPKALVGYPGERPVLGSGSNSRGFYIKRDTRDWTIAKLGFKASSAAIHMQGSGGRLRLVGNEAEWIPSAYGTIGLKACTDCKILGNHVFSSGRAGNKLAHLIYYGGYGVGANVEIAWNLLHDEKGGRGIQIYGHTDSDRLSGLSIHDNIIYNCPYDGILVGASDAAFKGWITDATVYNNIVYNTGGGVRIDNPGVNAKVLHNTLYRNSTSIKLEKARAAEVHNNISSLPTGSHLRFTMTGALALSHNGYQGTQAAPGQDANPTKGDPLFTNAAGGNFSLKSSSPFMNKGKVLSPALPKVSVPMDSAPDLGQMQWKVGTVPY